MPDYMLESGDTPELEALFDSIAKQSHEQTDEAAAAPEGAGEQTQPGTGGVINALPSDPQTMYDQIGQLTRKLHDTMRAMGYDKSLERVAESMPDAKDRLSYIATLTEGAAERVLNATDIAKPIQDELEKQATELSGHWDQVFANQLGVDQFKTLARNTQQFLHQVPQQTQATSTQLLEIVMAQDFQDLTGQVIKKMMEMVNGIESELLNFLIENSPTGKKVDLDQSLLNGPVTNPEGRSDVVTNQKQVDDLLESLGF